MKQSPGRKVSLLVCGEMLSGTATADTIYVHIELTTLIAGIGIKSDHVKVWNGRRFCDTTKAIRVVDLRPRIKF